MQSYRPSLSSLRAFQLVVETGSLSAAATRLNVTQPAVSRRIRELEAGFGIALLRRGANAALPTDSGRRLAEALRPGFAAVDAACNALVHGNGPLRIRALNTWAMHWLIPRLPKFRALHPEFEVAVEVSLLPVDFARDAVDLAVAAADAAPSTPGAARLQAVTLQPMALAALRRGRAASLSGLTLLGSRARPDYWAEWARGGGVALDREPILYETTNLAIQAAIGGLGAVIVTPALLAGDKGVGRLRGIGPCVATGRHYWLLRRPGPQSPAASAFAVWLQKEAG